MAGRKPSDPGWDDGSGPVFRFDADEAKPDIPPLPSLEIANWWLRARRLRDTLFAPGLFADPAWDILLDLYASEARGESVQISSLAFAARVPHSTAIRWARIMTSKGLILREKDPHDARRVHVRLSPLAHEVLAEFFGRLCAQGQVPAPVLAKPP